MLKKIKNNRTLLIITATLFFIILVLIPIYASRPFVYLLITCYISIIYAYSLYIVLGTCGILSFGHAAFFGIGAYAAGITIKAGFPLSVIFLASIIFSSMGALIIGWISLRAKEIYFAFLTLALSQLVYITVYRLPITGRYNGLPGIIPPLLNLGLLKYSIVRPEHFYYVALIIAILCVVISIKIHSSSLGYLFQAIREDSVRAEFMGINLNKYRLFAFIIGGAMASIAGALFSMKMGIVVPEVLMWTQSAKPIIMVLFGGIGNIYGPFFGAILFEIFHSYAAKFPYAIEIANGVLILIVIIVAPEGITGIYFRIKNKIIYKQKIELGGEYDEYKKQNTGSN
jgi:branched-chain amino acid transport system permease protein